MRLALPALVLCAALSPVEASAQAAVRLIPDRDAPVVFPYATCRTVPPDDPVALDYFKLRSERTFQDWQRLNDLLAARPLDRLSAVEAELYFLTLRQMAFRNNIENSVRAETRMNALIRARERGRPIADLYRNDSLVRCAYLGTELRVMDSPMPEVRFSEGDKDAVRDLYIAFLEDAVSGKVRVEAVASELQFVLGDLYLDKGFRLLPDTRKAAAMFEAGGRYLLDAAANPRDPQEINSWRRYAAVLDKLPLKQQAEIAGRLLAHIESSWAAKPDMTVTELDVYVHVLYVAGQLSMATKNGKNAVSIQTRALKAAQRLRQHDQQDPNYQVSEVLANLYLGDAYAVVGDKRASKGAYRDATLTYDSAGDAAKAMIDFPEELKVRGVK